MRSCNVAGAFFNPKGIRLKTYVPKGVVNAVLGLSAGAISICQIRCARSITIPACLRKSIPIRVRLSLACDKQINHISLKRLPIRISTIVE